MTDRLQHAAFAILAGALLAGAPVGCSSPTSTHTVTPVAKNDRIDPADAVGRDVLREAAIERLVLAAQEPDPAMRAHAIEGLMAVPTRLGPLIPQALNDPNIGVRTVALMAAGELRLDAARPLIQPLTNDASPYVRAAAVYAGTRLQIPGITPTPLAGILLAHESPLVRAHVAVILGKLADPSALGLLRQAAIADMPRAARAQVNMLQLQLAEARVRLGDEGAMHEVRAALYPSRPEQLEGTALAAQIIGAVDDKASIDQLIYLTARRDEGGRMMPAEVRLTAAASLAQLGLPRGSFIADQYINSTDATHRALAAYVYGELGQPAALSNLNVGLQDSDRFVQVSSASAIVRIAGADRQALSSHDD